MPAPSRQGLSGLLSSSCAAAQGPSPGAKCSTCGCPRSSRGEAAGAKQTGPHGWTGRTHLQSKTKQNYHGPPTPSVPHRQARGGKPGGNRFQGCLRHGQEGPEQRRPGRYLHVAQVGCRTALSPMHTEPCDAAARGGFKEGPGQVPYSTATSKTLVLLRPGNIPA